MLPQDQVHSLGEIATEENNNTLNTISEMDEEIHQGALFMINNYLLEYIYSTLV